jgi:hypothetical protein
MENGIDKKISKSRSYLEAATICREEAKRFIDEMISAWQEVTV